MVSSLCRWGLVLVTLDVAAPLARAAEPAPPNQRAGAPSTAPDPFAPTPSAPKRSAGAASPADPFAPPPAEPKRPAGAASPADPFAPTPSVDDEEAAALGAPDAGRPTAPSPAAVPPAPPPAARSNAPRPRPRPHQPAAGDDDTTPAPPDPPAFVIELATTGFASGALDGGLFLGGRLPGGLILGGSVDYVSTSVARTDNATTVTISSSTFRIGGGVRYPIVRTADRRVDLYGVGDASIAFTSADVPADQFMLTTTSVSATGISLAVGPGLRLWLTDHLAVGYAARLRLTFFSGAVGALSTPPSNDNAGASSTVLAFDGVFQILGVF